MKRVSAAEIEKRIEEDRQAAQQTRWEIIGFCAMDTAGLLIADPCYVIATRRNAQGELEPNPATGESVEIDDYNAWLQATGEIVSLPFKLGHDGAGVIIHSPNGDGTVDVWGKVDATGRIRSVFFSFDGEKPEEG